MSRRSKRKVRGSSKSIELAPRGAPIGPGNPPMVATKRTPQARAAILAELCAGSTKSAAAGAGGMALRTLNDWRADDPAFAAEIEDALAIGEVALLRRHREIALEEKDLRGIEWQLAMLRPDVYGRKANTVELAAGVSVDADSSAKLALRAKLSIYLDAETPAEEA